MATTLEIINSFTANLDGNTYTGKQGEISDLITDGFAITVTGPAHVVPGTLATATVVTVYDDDNDVPIDWVYMYIWTEVAMDIQLIGSSTNVILKTVAKVPFVLSNDSLLAAADTTPIIGGTQAGTPAGTLQDIDSVVLGNYSGNSGRYLAAFFN